MHATVFLADDDPIRRATVRAALASMTVREIPRLTQLPEACRERTPDAVLIGADAINASLTFDVIDAIRHLDRRLPVLLIMDGGSELLAIAALRSGVTDYLPCPARGDQVLSSIERCLVEAARDDQSATGPSPPLLLGRSAEMRAVREYLTHVAARDSNVLITGETGTGKELAAAVVHGASRRARRPFVPVVCAAIPDTLLESELFGHEKGAFTGAAGGRMGLFQAANRGTIFLDEVGDIGLAAQAKILRAIESREVYRVGGRAPTALDVRVIAATNRDLEEAVEQGTFRKDLYYRLNVARVHLPPLRERRGDIGQLLDHYIGLFNAQSRTAVALSDEARQALDAYDWPGNVRELKNLVESLFVCPRGDPVRIEDLPPTLSRKLEGFCSLDRQERRALLDALFAARWNKSRAADILRCSRMTLYRRMAKYSVVTSGRPAARRAVRKA